MVTVLTLPLIIGIHFLCRDGSPSSLTSGGGDEAQLGGTVFPVIALGEDNLADCRQYLFDPVDVVELDV